MPCSKKKRKTNKLKNELYRRIVELIASSSLKEKLENESIVLPELSLLHIAYKYAPEDENLALIKELANEFESTDAKQNAENCVSVASIGDDCELELECRDCEKVCLYRVCVPPMLPRFLRHGDIIEFSDIVEIDEDHDELVERRAYVIFFADDDRTEVDSYCAIPLDLKLEEYKDPEIVCYHAHIPAAELERVDRVDLNAAELERAEALDELFSSMDEYRND